MNILLIEDNLSIIKGLSYYFESNNYNLIYKTNISDALKYINENKKINLIILDIMLPDGNCVELYKKKILNLGIPTIFLTAKDDEDEIVKCLNLGAEDFMTKPFSTKELLARVNKIINRFQKQNKIQIKDIIFDLDKMILYKNNKPVSLSPLELKIINLLFSNLNKVISRDILLDKIWEWTGNDVDDHTITVYFKRIREKIGTDIIITIKGIGYRIDEK